MKGDTGVAIGDGNTITGDMAEYKLQEFIEALKTEDVAARLVNDEELVKATVWYCKGSGDTLVQEIRAMNDSDKKIMVQALLTIYPISANVVERLVREDKPNLFDEDELFNWFDIGRAMVSSLNIFKNKVTQSGAVVSNKKKMYERFLEDYDRETEALNAMQRELEANQKDQLTKHQELEKLRNTVLELQTEWSEEEIERKVEKLQSDIRVRQAAKADAERRIRELENELHECTNTSKDFDKALAALDKAMKAALKDSTES